MQFAPTNRADQDQYDQQVLGDAMTIMGDGTLAKVFPSIVTKLGSYLAPGAKLASSELGMVTDAGGGISAGGAAPDGTGHAPIVTAMLQIPTSAGSVVTNLGVKVSTLFTDAVNDPVCTALAGAGFRLGYIFGKFVLLSFKFKDLIQKVVADLLGDFAIAESETVVPPVAVGVWIGQVAVEAGWAIAGGIAFQLVILQMEGIVSVLLSGRLAAVGQLAQTALQMAQVPLQSRQALAANLRTISSRFLARMSGLGVLLSKLNYKLMTIQFALGGVTNFLTYLPAGILGVLTAALTFEACREFRAWFSSVRAAAPGLLHGVDANGTDDVLVAAVVGDSDDVVSLPGIAGRPGRLLRDAERGRALPGLDVLDHPDAEQCVPRRHDRRLRRDALPATAGRGRGERRGTLGLLRFTQGRVPARLREYARLRRAVPPARPADQSLGAVAHVAGHGRGSRQRERPARYGRGHLAVGDRSLERLRARVRARIPVTEPPKAPPDDDHRQGEQSRQGE
jgi:hypothetical protein